MTTLTSGLQRLIHFIERSEEHLTVQKAAALVRDAKITEDDLEPWADYDHPIEDGYGRRLVYQNARYEIMVMTWKPGDYSCVHDHGYTQWGAVQVFGNAMHRVYSNSGEKFRLCKSEVISYGGLMKVTNSLIHQMGNVTSSPFLSLHVYGANQPHEAVTADMKVYEVETGLVRKTQGGAFFDLSDEEAPVIGQMKQIEAMTFVHYASILLPYYCRYDDQKFSDKKQVLLSKLSTTI